MKNSNFTVTKKMYERLIEFETDVCNFNPTDYIVVEESEDGVITSMPFFYQLIWFKKAYPNGKIISQIKTIGDNQLFAETSVYKENDILISNAFAYVSDIANINLAEIESGSKALEKAGFGFPCYEGDLFKDIEEYNQSPDTQQADKKPKSTRGKNSKNKTDTTKNKPSEEQATPETDNQEILKDKLSEVETTAETTQIKENPVQMNLVSGSDQPTQNKTEDIGDKPDGETSAKDTSVSDTQQSSNSDNQQKPNEDTAETVVLDKVVELDISTEKPSLLASSTGEADSEVSNAGNGVYNNSMTVDEIASLMPLDEAKNYMATAGIFANKMTIGKIGLLNAESLHWYFNDYEGSDNIMRAAAKLVYQDRVKQAV